MSPNQDYRINCNFGVHIIQADTPWDAHRHSPDTAINGALLALNSVNGNTSNPVAFYDEAPMKRPARKSR